MDVRQYADLFLSESRDHLTAFNHLLLDWERDPTAQDPVGGIFRAVHTIKGMAATMGYQAVAELAHRLEDLLDLVRRGERAAGPALFDLLFRSADALDKAVQDAVAGRESSAGALLAELQKHAGGEAVPASFESETYDGRLAFRIDTDADAAQIGQAIRTAGDVDAVEVAAEEAHDVVVEAVRARSIRVDQRRLDQLMNLIGELAIARGRLRTLTAKQDGPTSARCRW